MRKDMIDTYNFQTPRNIFEKLQRDSIRLDKVLDGDHMFNFISTAFHLQEWIKKSPVNSSTVVKRFMKRLNHDENLILCGEILSASKHFIVSPVEDGCQLNVDGVCVDAAKFKNDIMELYEIFFKLK